MSRRIFVGNVNDRISEDRLRRHFEAVGEVTSVTIPADRKTGRSRGYAFVEFGSHVGARPGSTLTWTKSPRTRYNASKAKVRSVAPVRAAR